MSTKEDSIPQSEVSTKEDSKHDLVLSTKEDIRRELASLDLNPRQLGLVIEIALNDGNVSKAARAMGYNPDHARALASQNPVFRQALEIVRQRLRAGVVAPLVEWAAAGGRAREVLLDLLEASTPVYNHLGEYVGDRPDNSTRAVACKTILEYAEGKPAQRVQLDGQVEHSHSIDPELLRLALSLMAAKDWAFGQALDYVQRHPDEVRGWLISGPAVPAEVVSGVCDSE